jgi:hypothetical protein
LWDGRRASYKMQRGWKRGRYEASRKSNNNNSNKKKKLRWSFFFPGEIYIYIYVDQSVFIRYKLTCTHSRRHRVKAAWADWVHNARTDIGRGVQQQQTGSSGGIARCAREWWVTEVAASKASRIAFWSPSFFFFFFVCVYVCVGG